MARVGRGEQNAGQRAALLTCVSLCVSALSAAAYAEETAALRLARHVQSLQAQYGSYAPQVLPPLVELGTLYGTGQCEHALELLELALDISHRADGLLNTGQLPIYSTLMDCHLTLDLPGELARAQRYVTLIYERQFDRKDPRLLQAFDEGARRYEAAGLYFSARRLHEKALRAVRSTAGHDDMSLVRPLRGMARAYRLEYTYGLALPDILDPDFNVSSLRSFAATDLRFDARGQESLEEAVDILRRHPDAVRERIDTLVELGDWHQLAGHHRAAVNAWREAWRDLHSAELPDTALPDPELFHRATPLLFSAKNSTPLRRAPHPEAGMRKYTIDLAYDVARDGEPKDVRVIESNASRGLTDKAVADLREMLHRPKFENGEPVEDRGLQYRRNIYARAKRNE